MNKGIFYIFLLMLCTNSWAKDKNKMLVCLGIKEFKFHKKHKVVPNYKLNQLFVNELAGLSNIPIKDSYLKLICKDGAIPPSVNLLKFLLTDGKKVFDTSKLVGLNEGVIAYNKALIQGFLHRIPHIFFKYIASLQSLASTPNCLANKIPHLKEFIERYHYLEADYDTKQLISSKKKINIIFKHIINIKKVYKKCRQKKSK